MSSAEGISRPAPAMPPAVARRFEAIVFDWDGTAVPDRGGDATRMRALVERDPQTFTSAGKRTP